MDENTMVDTDLLLSNERRFRELPIEARHSICLEIAKRKRQSVATSIFIPKELSRKIRFVKKHQRREKNETATNKQSKLKNNKVVDKKNNVSKFNNLKKKSLKCKRQTMQSLKQSQVSGIQTHNHSLKHPESYPIVKQTIATQKIRSVVESLREKQDEHEEQHELQEHDELQQQHELQQHDELQEQDKLQEQGKLRVQAELREQVELQEQEELLKQHELQEQNEMKETVPSNQTVQSTFTQPLTNHTKLVEEQIQLGSEQKMTISYTVELPVNQINSDNIMPQNYSSKVETSEDLKTPQHYNYVEMNSYGTLYAIDESAKTQNAEKIKIPRGKLLKKEPYFRECTNYIEHFNQPALASDKALMAANSKNWNTSFENQFQQAYLPVRNTNIEQTNIQKYQRPMPQENASHHHPPLDPLHNDFHVAQSNRMMQFHMDNYIDNYKQQYLMPQATNYIDHNFTQMSDSARGLTFFAHPSYPHYYHQQQQQHPQQQQRSATDSRSLQPPTAPTNYTYYCQDRLQIDPILQNLNNQERCLTNPTHNAFTTWHHPVRSHSSKRRNLASNKKRAPYRQQEHRPQISSQQQQNISTATYDDHIPSLQPEYFCDRTTYQTCNSFNDISQNYPMDLAIPMNMPPIPPLQYQHPQIEYQIQPYQKLYPPNCSCNSCSIAVPSYAVPPQNFNHAIAQLQPADLALEDPNSWYLNKQRDYFFYCGLENSTRNNWRNIRTM